jgi:hypothetical protein
MSNNIEKILYICAGLLIFAYALFAFFSGYDSFKTYLSIGEDITKKDNTVDIYADASNWGISGSEIILQVYNTKKQEETLNLMDFYNENNNAPDDFRYTIFIDGVRAEEIDISNIHPSEKYSVSYVTDKRGRILEVSFISYP